MCFSKKENWIFLHEFSFWHLELSDFLREFFPNDSFKDRSYNKQGADLNTLALQVICVAVI